jgi:NAD(P)-dependent dehydrogenase (short-subunit alcohol dehydrogenase family)
MRDLKDKLAVVTGGGTGIGRELVRQLAAAGCHVATCDVAEEAMAETRTLAGKEGAAGVQVTAHVANVAHEEDLLSFRDAVAREHGAEALNLLFNNAGIGGGGSFVAGPREQWERTFGVSWYGVYYGCRAFLPMLLAADAAHIVNTSSVNGFWASLGPGVPHTAYCAAKFAIKGFSEALIEDLRVHAPHVKVSVVMPGHIGTEIVANTFEQQGTVTIPGFADVDPAQVETFLQEMATRFRETAPTTPAEAAKVILDGVREERWRILVGEDAHNVDAQVRKAPEEAYDPTFFERLRVFAAR